MHVQHNSEYVYKCHSNDIIIRIRVTCIKLYNHSQWWEKLNASCHQCHIALAESKVTTQEISQ